VECGSEGVVEAALPYVSISVVIPCNPPALGLITGGREAGEKGELHSEGDVVSVEMDAMTLSDWGHKARGWDDQIDDGSLQYTTGEGLTGNRTRGVGNIETCVLNPWGQELSTAGDNGGGGRVAEGHWTLPVYMMAVEVAYHQQREGRMRLRGSLNVLKDSTKVDRGLSSLRLQVDHSEKEGGAMSGTDDSTDHCRGGGDSRVWCGVDACAVSGEDEYRTVFVVEERDATTSHVVLSFGVGTREMVGGPVTDEARRGVTGLDEGIEEGSGWERRKMVCTTD
jgi:hypothetical protein